MIAAKAKRQIGDFFISLPSLLSTFLSAVGFQRRKWRTLLSPFLFPFPPFLLSVRFPSAAAAATKSGERRGGPFSLRRWWRRRRRRREMKFFAGGILQLAKLVGCLQLCGTVGFRRGKGGGTARYLGGSRVCSPLGN